MALQDTMSEMEGVLTDLIYDLGKVTKGNKSAAQRVRVGTISLAKIAKLFRKESMAAEKGGKLKKKKMKKKKR